MSIYSAIYYSLCQKRSQLKESWHPGSNLHRHHVIPKHSGGTDEDSNYTYLTIREHIIAHFLLWKIHRNPNDLRSMKMLGANITSKQRKIMGEWCRDNKIGFHNATPEQRKEWSKKGLQTQKNNNDKNSFYYWSTKDGQKERASMGGKIGGKKQKEHKLGWHQPHIQLKAASLGGRSHKGKRCMYRPGDKSFIRVKPEDVFVRLQNGFIFGSPIKSNHKNIKSSSDI